MQPARIAELLSPFLDGTDERLTIDDLDHISTYIDLLLHWNARINLTAIRDPEQIVTRHFGESLFAARHLFPNRNVGTAAPGCPAEQSSAVARPDQHAINRAEKTVKDKRALASETGRAAETRGPTKTGRAAEAGRLAETERPAERRRAAFQGRVAEHDPKSALAPALADIGPGAGFPGIPIKLWAPEITLTLIESNHKKSTFLREVTRALTLTNVNIQTARAETLAASFDVVTLRAVERFEAILPASAPLVALGGRLALLIGSGQWAKANTLLPDLLWSEPIPIPLSASRVLSIATRPSNKASQVS